VTLFRDATLFKVIYGYGLRRREAAMLEVADFTRNPAVPEFGRYGVSNVRWGKAARGSPPRRRAVLTVFDWLPGVLDEYVHEVLPRFAVAPGPDGGMLWPTERQSRVRLSHLDDRFAEYRDALGLDPALHPHCLRHSYITHLIEDGYDPLFVQQQAGHRWGSTTALYTGVSGDYRNTVLRRALDRAFVPPPALPSSSSSAPVSSAPVSSSQGVSAPGVPPGVCPAGKDGPRPARSGREGGGHEPGHEDGRVPVAAAVTDG
jgi:site-specific recombinase XerD